MLPELVISDTLLSYECPWCLCVFYQGHRLFFFCCISTGFSTHFILLLLLHLYFSKFRGSHPAKKIKMKQTGRLLFSERLLGKLEALYRGLMLLIFFLFLFLLLSPLPAKALQIDVCLEKDTAKKILDEWVAKAISCRSQGRA